MTQANVGIQGTKYQKRSNLSMCASKSESQKPQYIYQNSKLLVPVVYFADAV